ncbi:TIGR02221 family CRISPR-associated protein [Desulfonema ishimotonii]|uniref:TIGR02221 family CRISPR-associated protein n=1 Tax=Desulfonema ishimotonii TaxID=45657 RepID=A0A401G1N6_9BACT|nr:TIGR02221 family CRISPR-associated protein [Desulfonema ishimotonii]GBC63132.1 TIGR02221 family CRISPR-associated protein [Desulfonema ishimotonii]
MAKVYISFLGTSDYLRCIYHLGEKAFENIRFVQEATIGFHCETWSANDRILTFLTDEACQKNWLDNGHKNRKTGEMEQRKGLKQCIRDMNLAVPFYEIPIKAGKSEAEIWENFDTVLAQLNEGDEVILDITHAFRSIPMLAIVVMNYAKVVKNIYLSGIYYGAFEVLGSIQDADNLPVKDRNVPVFDLTAFNTLMEWSVAIDRFIKSGDASHARNLAMEAITPTLAATRGQDKTAAVLKNVANEMERFSKNISTCRGPKIAPSVRTLRQRISECEDSDLLKPFKPLFDRLRQQIAVFEDDEVLAGIQAARWCLERNLIQQGFTILQETLVSFFVIRSGGSMTDITTRNLVNQAIAICGKGIPKNEWTGDARKYPEKIENYKRLIETYGDMIKTLSSIKPARNDLNHAGYTSESRTPDKFERELKKHLNQLETTFREPESSQ